MTALAPDYTLHRSAVTAPDADFTKSAEARNLAEHHYANIQVVPSGGANPTVEVMWWSEAAGKFISENPVNQKVGLGADTPFEFSVAANGRRMFIAVTAITGGSVDVYVGGFDVERYG